ncbi:hypothetical protein BH09PSE6_BH09PSE6_21880 [soil metagenome]
MSSPVAPQTEAVLTMPRVRVSTRSLEMAPADLAASQEPELWERMQRAAGLARAGKPFEAAAEFGSVTDSVLALDEPRLLIIGAKAAYNRAIVIEKLINDAKRAEMVFEQLHQSYAGSTAEDIQLVAARSGLHSARLAGEAGRLADSVARYQERLGRFRDVLPPAELRVFHVDYQNRREEARKRGVETPVSVVATQPVQAAAPKPGEPITADRLQSILDELRTSLRADLHADLSAEIGRLKVSLTDLNSDLVSLHGQQRALLTQQSERDALLREDHRIGALAIRNEMRRFLDQVTKYGRIIVFGGGIVAVALAGLVIVMR